MPHKGREKSRDGKQVKIRPPTGGGVTIFNAGHKGRTLSDDCVAETPKRDKHRRGLSVRRGPPKGTASAEQANAGKKRARTPNVGTNRNKQPLPASRAASRARSRGGQKEKSQPVSGDKVAKTPRPPPRPQTTKVYAQEFLDATVKRGVQGLEEDFRKLKMIPPSELQLKAQVGRQNPSKNRYRDVICTDETRVQLKSEEGDYIHANYVKINDSRQFILTQGPTISTITDFWNMVYQTQSGAIVMLCEIVENNKPKCEQYWPTDSKKMICGDLQITLEESEVKGVTEVTLSKLTVLKGPQSSPLSIDHHQWVSWPDRGVPDSCRVAIELLDAIKNVNMPIIHCSAGIGRSGSLAAIEMCKEHLNEDVAPLNVSDMVERLREQRLHSVQTPQQFVFIHAALMEICLANGWAKEHPDYKNFKS